MRRWERAQQGDGQLVLIFRKTSPAIAPDKRMVRRGAP
jgi:hypothetical protein